MKNGDQEQWADIPGYEGRYRVSTHGRVRSLITSKILKPYIHTRGYLKLILCKDNQKKKYFIHRLVAMAFIPSEGVLPVVNHSDGDKTNNHVMNLEWMSFSDNTKHYFQVIRKMDEVSF